MLVKFSMIMYGDYQCSCGCGQPLGHPGVYDVVTCKGVGDDHDVEGYDYRMFTPECWERLNLDNVSEQDIYNKYPASSEVE